MSRSCSALCVWVVALPVCGWEVSQRSAKQTSTPCLTLGSFIIQQREINVFRDLGVIFWTSALGWDELSSPLAGWEWSTKSSGIEVSTVDSYILTNESKPIFLYLPRLSAPSESALVGSFGVPPQGGTGHRYGRCPSSRQPCRALMENGPFLPIRTGQGRWETLPWLPTAPCSGQQVTLWDRQFLKSCQGHISRHKGWTSIILVSHLNSFLANEKTAVTSILSPRILVSSFFCFLGYRYQLCPWLPLRLRHTAFLVQPVLCQSLLFFRSTAHL